MKKKPESKQRKSTSLQMKYGDTFLLGEHLLVYGSATDEELIRKVLKDKKINATICDPPYGVSYVASKENFQTLAKRKHIVGDEITSDSEYIEFSKKWLSPVIPFLSKDNSVYIFNSDKMIFALRTAMLELGFKFSQLLIWVKDRAVIGRLDYLPQHELIAYGWYGRHHFRKSKSKSVLVFPKPNRSRLHPTMKPVGLLRHIILNSTKINETVYDPFAGSGTTLIACEHTKRKAIVIELDKEYCRTIIKRWEILSGNKAEKYEN